MKKQKLIGGFFISIALLGGVGVYLESLKPESLVIRKSQIKKSKYIKKRDLVINQLWRNDFKKLIEQGHVPKAWSKISQVVFFSTGALTKELIPYLQAPVQINKKGPYRLEVSIISHQSENMETQLLLQHNIIDIENDNTLWELNRTYPIYLK